MYIAEDDLDVLFAINTMLETHGYDVTVAHCGAPLLEKYLPAIDLLIIDKRMPDVDGLEVCRYLRAQPASKDVPIVMISAMRNFAESALKEGVNECLEKPFNMNDLLAVVSKHMVREHIA